MYLEIRGELVKLVFDRGMTLEPPRNPDGNVKPVADGILGGPHGLGLPEGSRFPRMQRLRQRRRISKAGPW